MLLADELMQGPQAAAPSGFDLDRNDLTFKRQDEVNFRICRAALAQPIRQFPVRALREQFLQMLADELLGDGALVDELNVVESGQGLPPQAADCIHQTYIEKEKFVDFFVQVCLQRQSGSMRVDYFGDDACHGQQIDVLPDRRAVNVFQNVGVFDFRPDISRDEIEHVLHPDQISRWRVFLKILPV